jgi:hypothetical protein
LARGPTVQRPGRTSFPLRPVRACGARAGPAARRCQQMGLVSKPPSLPRLWAIFVGPVKLMEHGIPALTLGGVEAPDPGGEDVSCRRSSHPGGGPRGGTPRRKAAAVRMVPTLRAELGSKHGTVKRVPCSSATGWSPCGCGSARPTSTTATRCTGMHRRHGRTRSPSGASTPLIPPVTRLPVELADSSGAAPGRGHM